MTRFEIQQYDRIAMKNMTMKWIRDDKTWKSSDQACVPEQHENENEMTKAKWHEKDSDQACELCEEVAEVIGGVKSEPRHAVAQNQTWAQHQLGKILK